MYYFSLLVFTRHISLFKHQQNSALVGIFTSIQIIVIQIHVSEHFFLNHLPISFPQNIFWKMLVYNIYVNLKVSFL